MSFDGWLVFAGFWILFVTTPGPNAANCIQNGMSLPFGRALIGVLAILTQASVFLVASAAGVAALIVTAPTVFFWAQIVGAVVLVWLGVRGWRRAGVPLEAGAVPDRPRDIYMRALFIATVNAKSLAGYVAAFTQFVEPDVPMRAQLGVLFPTALVITSLSYVSYTALGAALGKLALGALGNRILRRVLAGCFVVYGVALGATAVTGAIGAGSAPLQAPNEGV
ncbi:MAG: LysE family translocator [Pseudomonadota bacterium]